MTTPDPEQIAAGLTKAQRAAIRSGTFIPSIGPYGYNSFILGGEHGRSAKALHRLGLVHTPFAYQILTRLGLTVRNIVKGQPNDR